ncbi:monooxygenase FAD-binding protein (plasmid) [Cupriavidus necator N-1]|uniref:Monooxygenase FAD-binding protein n=1 Tax=Cupriavidus necator (strain ATCC 43291 / DSM 13513 / CCUG 52238 / LMG 8453 / N-1) TaxID=1042878 RepID=F8GWH5_CUPNN|nr:FAD-dependent oxidoreductase [Cupriavidus necator]AEI82783.1 monooxygenase FAD-binding protein [Cupriavidus necator N-1]MDX6007778.1 FAD-dependent oxidoreductase [Cupriavidus necator]
MKQLEHALVVGGGIAGCSAAIALAQAGVRVTMLEKQQEWRFQSSGIFIYHNGLAALGSLGVLPQILSSGFAIADGRNIYLDQHGKPIVDTFYPSSHRDIPPIVGIRRAEMHRVLAGRLDALGVDIRLGTTVVRIDQHAADHVTVALSDDTTGQYDLVVGADGIRSNIRRLVAGPLEPAYTGLGVWRSVHVRPRDLTAKVMMMGVGKRLGIMPISDDQLYLFGTLPEPAGTWYDRADWPALMQARFAEFGGPARQFLDALSPGAEVLYTAVEEVAAPLPWHHGRVIMIGDAAHASTPFMGQGGAMALEDAVLLAQMLSREADVETTLQAFGEARYPLCKFVQDTSRKVGEAGAREGATLLAARNETMQRTAQRQVDDFYARMDALRHQLPAAQRG